jgi:cobalt-zinc-cadmium efflux system membrane fusion protein
MNLKYHILFCVVLLSACKKQSENNDAENKTFTIENNQITVAENSPLLQNIKIQPVETDDYRATFSVSCEVRAIPSRYAEIASPFAGRIVKSFVRPGQKISQGSPVFEISSPSFFEAGKVYYQAKQEMDLALKTLERERDLLAHKVGVAKDLEEAEVNYELKKKDYEHAFAALKVYQIDPQETTLGQPLIVRSPIAGEIVKSDIVIGQYLREDADALAIVADLEKVWVIAYVKEKDIPMIRNIDEISIKLTALPGETILGSIYYVSEMLDEETRSVEVIIECANSHRQIKPYMYGTVQFTEKPAQAVVIPNPSVLQDEDNRYVIVSEGNNRFRKAIVDIASSDAGRTVVISGIRPGEKLVTDGAFYFIDAR